MVEDTVSLDLKIPRDITELFLGQTCHLVGEDIVVVGGMETSITGADVTYCMVRLESTRSFHVQMMLTMI